MFYSLTINLKSAKRRNDSNYKSRNFMTKNLYKNPFYQSADYSLNGNCHGYFHTGFLNFSKEN